MRNDALRCQRWNLLHPAEPPPKSYVETTAGREQGAFIAVSDSMTHRAGPDCAVGSGGLTTLGTDGFGRSDTRPGCGASSKWTRNPPSSPP